MATAQIIGLIENAGCSMTFEEGLAFIERSRRQMQRLSELPALHGTPADPDREARIFDRLDKLELSIRASMSQR